MDFLTRITEAVNYIENNLDGEINEAVLSKIICCSMHQFGRVFSYVCDMSLAEYIRRRRMTLAAADLQNGDKVIDVALKFGYNSPDSFAKAFFALHGVTPREAAKGEAVTYYPRISFYITIKGGDKMNYRIVEKEEFKIVGITLGFGKEIFDKPDVDLSKYAPPSKYPKREFTINISDEAVPDGMKKVLKSIDGKSQEVDVYAAFGHLCRAPLWRVGLTQTLDNGTLQISVGAEADDGEYHKNITWNVPGGTWAVFPAKGKLFHYPDESNQQVFMEVLKSARKIRDPERDAESLQQPIDKIFARAEVEWMDQSGYERAGNYEMMVYPFGDTESDDYCCEAWIPVRKKII